MQEQISNSDVKVQERFKRSFDDLAFKNYIYKKTIDRFFFPDTLKCPNICALDYCIEAVFKSLDKGIKYKKDSLFTKQTFFNNVLCFTAKGMYRKIENIIENDKDLHDYIVEKRLYHMIYKKAWLKAFVADVKYFSFPFTELADYGRFIKFMLCINENGSIHWPWVLRDYLVKDFDDSDSDQLD